MAKQSIERAPKDADNPYRMINRKAMEDERLSFEARGVLAYILVKPDNWRIQVADLKRAGNMGRDKTYRILNELIVFGYVIRKVERKDDGTIGDTVYRVDEKPTVMAEQPPEKPDTAEPLPEKPDTAEPDTAEPDTAEPDTAEPLPVNTDSNNKEEFNNKEVITNKEGSSDGHADDDETRVAIKILSNTLQSVGVGLSQFIVDQYLELVTNHGLRAVVAGIHAAAENNKQHRFKYVATCIANAASGTRPIYANGIPNRKESVNGNGKHGSNGLYQSATKPAADNDASRRQREYNERYTSLLADEINGVIAKDAAAKLWEQIDAEFPDFQYREVR